MRSWSNSALTTLQMCGHKWYLRYIKKDWRPVGYAAKRGVAVHHVAKETHKRQMVEAKIWDGSEPEVKELPGSPRAVEEARDLAASEFEREVNKGDGCVLMEKERDLGHEVVKASAKDCAVDLAGLYVSEVAPLVKPVAIERRVEIAPKGLDYKIMGVIDLVDDDLGDVIRDLKTSEKSPWAGAADVSQQLTLYNWIRYAEKRKLVEEGKLPPEEAKLPRESKLVNLIRTPKTNDMSVVVQTTTRTMDDIKMLVARIKTAVDAVEKGVFVPADPAAAGSPCGWCEFNDGTCPYYRKREK